MFESSVSCLQCFCQLSILYQSLLKTIYSAQLRFFFFFVFLPFYRAALTAYGDSQARDPVGAVAAGLHQRHGNAGSELCLQPTPQLIATPDP